MILDSHTTARCKKCGWRKQFRPGVEYELEEFKCDCTSEKPKPKPKIVKKASDGKQS